MQVSGAAGFDGESNFMGLEVKDGKILVVGNEFTTKHLHGKELVPVSKAQWEKENEGYI